jgi:hypothetical protein
MINVYKTGTCSMDGRVNNVYKIVVRKSERKRPLGRLCINQRIMLTWSSKNWCVRVSAELN